MNDLVNWIKKCEGFKTKVYKDSVGKLTIGWGRNIEDVGISADEAEIMLNNDINRCIKELSQYSWYLNQPQCVKDALINMCFNMGLERLLGFRLMISALINKNYLIAAQESLNSNWANQVGIRAVDVSIKIREGSQYVEKGADRAD